MRRNTKALLVTIPVAGLLATGGATAAAFASPGHTPVTAGDQVREQVHKQLRDGSGDQVRKHLRQHKVSPTSTTTGSKQQTVRPGTGDRDRDRTQDRLRDGSCLTASSYDQDQLRTQDRTRDPIKDLDRVQDQLRDGSCQS